MKGSYRFHYHTDSLVTVAHPKQSPAPLPVPHFVSKPGDLTKRLNFGKQLHHGGAHLFDVTKPHANVEPIQNRARSLRYRPPDDTAQPIGARTERRVRSPPPASRPARQSCGTEVLGRFLYHPPSISPIPPRP